MVNECFKNYTNLSYDQLNSVIKRYTDYNEIYKKEKDIPSLFSDIVDKNLYYDPIKSIEKTGRIVKMYDLEVENHQEFTCNGIVVHNSQGSTYENCFVLNGDICLNNNQDERKRIQYTAFTRPRKMLYIM
jgi:hypothetical protein